MVVLVNGVGVDNNPAPPAARLPGRLAATAPGESTLKQASLTLRPVSTPPPTCTPRGSRAFIVTLKKSLTRVIFPKLSDCVITLLTRPNFAGLTSARPQT